MFNANCGPKSRVPQVKNEPNLWDMEAVPAAIELCCARLNDYLLGSDVIDSEIAINPDRILVESNRITDLTLKEVLAKYPMCTKSEYWVKPELINSGKSVRIHASPFMQQVLYNRLKTCYVPPPLSHA